MIFLEFASFKNGEEPFMVVMTVEEKMIISGGSKGARGMRAPRDPNSFNFMQFLGKFGKIVCWRPPLGVGPPPRGNPGSATDNGHQPIRVLPRSNPIH